MLNVYNNNIYIYIYKNQHFGIIWPASLNINLSYLIPPFSKRRNLSHLLNDIDGIKF